MDLTSGTRQVRPHAFEKHLFSERFEEHTCCLDFQDFRTPVVARFSERQSSAARAVATPTPSSRPISRQDRPCARRSDTRERSTCRRGRPSRIPAGPSRCQARTDAIANQLTLELCEAGEDAEHEASVGRGGVDTFMERDELNPEGVELRQRIDELTQTAREPVVSVDHDGIDAAPSAIGEELIQARSSFPASRSPRRPRTRRRTPSRDADSSPEARAAASPDPVPTCVLTLRVQRSPHHRSGLPTRDWLLSQPRQAFRAARTQAIEQQAAVDRASRSSSFQRCKCFKYQYGASDRIHLREHGPGGRR